MKPLNLDNKPCSPISSNCVVWQGPDIPCIALCTGDTISDVVHAMATELCTILDTLKVSNYDLTCFNLQACGPENFQDLIQFLIEQICAKEGIGLTKEIPACPDCVVSVAECFVTGNQTTMQLVDYVQLIGEKICSIIDEISLINTQITDILIRLTTLENTPVPTFTIPSFTIGCQIGSLLSGTTQPIDTLLEEFINNLWCGFYTVTGSTTDLTNAINTQEPCITETSDTISKPGTTYGTLYPAWEDEPSTVANSITNIWLVLCDLYTALASASQSITVADTATIDLTLSGTEVLTANITDTGWIDLLGFSYIQGAIASARPRCRRIGNILYFKGTLTVPIATGSSGKPLQDGGGSAVILSTDTSYNNTLSGFVLNTVEATSSSDTDACLLKTSAYDPWNIGDEAIRCSFHRGNSCIPAGILNTGETLDDSGGNLTGNVIGTRFARTKSSFVDHCLSGIVRMSISSSGVLSMNSANFEDFYRGGGAAAAANGKSSMLRQFCSKAVEDQLIPQFDITNVTSSIFGIDPTSPPTPPYPAQLDSSATNTVDDVFGFNQDMSRADQIGGLQINLSNLQVIINES